MVNSSQDKIRVPRKTKMVMQKRTVVIVLAVASVLMIASVLALLSSTKTIPSAGTISAFRVLVYENDTTTPVITPFNFDSVANGSSTYRDIYVKNAAGNKNMSLSMTVDTWVGNPTNATDIGVTLTWNATGTLLAPNTGQHARLTLTVPDNAQTEAGLSFTVNINVVGTEA
jgi:hypothetical protein